MRLWLRAQCRYYHGPNNFGRRCREQRRRHRHSRLRPRRSQVELHACRIVRNLQPHANGKKLDLPSAYTAPPAAPSGGSVTIIATSVASPSRSASVPIAITGVLTQNFVFYASGEENVSPNFPVYSIAGVVAIAQVASADGSFAVVSGEQDYNDGVTITSLQPGGDSISGGSLSLAANGVGTLTLHHQQFTPRQRRYRNFCGLYPKSQACADHSIRRDRHLQRKPGP